MQGCNSLILDQFKRMIGCYSRYADLIFLVHRGTVESGKQQATGLPRGDACPTMPRGDDDFYLRY